MSDTYRFLTTTVLLGALALGGCDDAESDASATGGAASGGSAGPGGSPANTGGSGGENLGGGAAGGTSGTGGALAACPGEPHEWSQACEEEQARLCSDLQPGRCGEAVGCAQSPGDALNGELTCTLPTPAPCAYCDGWADGIFLAEDPDGVTWRFVYGCIPAGWTDVRVGGDWSYPSCDEVGGAGGGGAGGGGASAD